MIPRRSDHDEDGEDDDDQASFLHACFTQSRPAQVPSGETTTHTPRGNAETRPASHGTAGAGASTTEYNA